VYTTRMVSASPPNDAFTDDDLTPTRALILEAYYALRRVRTAASIGSGEIRHWIRQHEGPGQIPSESLVLSTLIAAGVPRRGTGRPRRVPLSAAPAAPPFVPVRRNQPKPSRSR